MSTAEGYCRCPRCGHGHARDYYDNRSLQEYLSCEACGRFVGWEYLDDMDRRMCRAATGERVDLDGTGTYILARFKQMGYGVASILTVGGRERRHYFRRPLTDRAVARLRRLLEADPTIDADACWITRWNGHALEVVHGTLPPGEYEWEMAMARYMELRPDIDPDDWGREEWEAMEAIVMDARREAGGE